MKEVLGGYSKEQNLADPHIHTNRSKDGHLEPNQIVEIAVVSELLHTIAITDHNTILGSAEAKDYGLKMGYPLNIVIGSEISTANGHLLALYIEHDIPSDQSVEDTIRQIHRQGGLAIAPHPFFKRIRSSLTQEKLLDVIRNEDPQVYLDGFEVFNAGVNSYSKTTAIQEANEFYLVHKDSLGAPIGSSDNHYFTIGRGLTGHTGDLKEAIKSGQTTVLMLEDQETAQVGTHALNLFPKEVKSLIVKLERYRKLKKNRE